MSLDANWQMHLFLKPKTSQSKTFKSMRAREPSHVRQLGAQLHVHAAPDFVAF
jgi:hypothetical protein